MIHAPILNNDYLGFWFNQLLSSNTNSFSHIRMEKASIQDIDLEINLTFGSFYCEMDCQVFVDSTHQDSCNATLLFLKDKVQASYDLFLRNSIPNEINQPKHFRNVCGKSIDLYKGTYYEFFVICFKSQRIEGIKTELIRTKSRYESIVQNLFQSILLTKPLKKHRILDQCKLLFDYILSGFCLNKSQEILFDNENSGLITSLKSLIELGFQNNIFDPKEFIQYFKLNGRDIEKLTKIKYALTFCQFYDQQKVHYAYQLLSKRTYSLKEISILFGYKSTAYFTNKLRRVYGRKLIAHSELS